MAFDTVTFWLFLPLAWLAWWGLPFRAAKSALLGLSLGFYAWWHPAYVGLVVVSAVVDFLVAPRIAASQRLRSRRAWLGVSLATNLGLLAVFKYTPFAVRSSTRCWRSASTGTRSPTGSSRSATPSTRSRR